MLVCVSTAVRGMKTGVEYIYRYRRGTNMKKNWLRNSLSLLLVCGMLLSAMPVGAVGTGMDDETTQFPAGEKPPIVIEPSDDETPILPVNPGTASATVLYSWAASDLNRDLNTFSSNLPDDTDPKQRWNETAWLYTGNESQKVSMHCFLNEAQATYGLKTKKDFAGRKAVENLQVDVYPMAQTSSTEVVSLAMVYAHKPEEYGMNPANSGLLQVYVSADGENWSEDFVKVRSARIVGSGKDENGKNIIYYEIFTENLKAVAGNEINALRIMPDGKSGVCGGSFSLCSLSLNGYRTVSAFNKAVPQENEGTKADRSTVLAAYKAATGESGLTRVQAAMAPVNRNRVNSIPSMLNTIGVRFADGVAVRATADVRQIFDWMVSYKLRTRENVQQILDKYEDVTSTEKVIKDLNRPQQIFKAYATCDVGDLLVQVKSDGKTDDVYMVAKKVSAQPDKAGNIDIATSTITYVDSAGTTHENAKLFDLYKQGFVPMVMDALADDTVQPVRLDANVSVTDQVRVVVSSNFDIEKIELSVGDFTDVVNRPGFATVYTHSMLDKLPAGKYTMTAKVYTAGNGTPIDVPVSFEIEGASMAVLANVDMANTLDMNFYVPQSSFKGEGYYAKMVGPNGTKTVLMSAWIKNGDYYQFTYGGLAAKQMSANITVTLYDAAGNRVSKPWVDSIRTYVMRMFDKVEDETRVLYADMLNYGAAAQTYFGYQTDDLANALLSEAQKAYATKTVADCSDYRVKGNNYYGTNFDLENRISMNLYFSNVTEDMTAAITFEDHYGQQHEVVVPGTDFGVNGSYKVINVSEIIAADGRQSITCTIRNGDEVVASVTDSLESYVARMSGSYPWLAEIMKFFDAAYNYLHS